MTGPTAGNPALNPPRNARNNEWTCVRWFNKISDAVASKTCRFFGRAVAAVVTVVAFIPSLAVDLVYAAKSLYDRKITIHQTPAPNLPVIPEAKVQWRRYIHDDDVKATMERHDRFLADNVLHHPEEIPEAAYQPLEGGDIPIELITPQNEVKTIKLNKKLRFSESRSYYDIGDGQALAINRRPYQFYDELMMNRYLEKLGIPTIEVQPVVIRWEFEGTKYTRATYITPSFSEHEKQNAFLVHHNFTEEEAERLVGKKLLAVGQDPLKPENWDEVLKPLVNDIRTLIDNGVSTSADSIDAPHIHKAILVGKGNKFHSGGPADYEIRAFPFEFANENVELDQLPPKKKHTAKEEESTLRQYIESAVFVQYDPKKYLLPTEWKKLVDELTERHLRR
ncbi:hypothetical protein [Endozoicomonas sp. YOMI1]|uniref:hypothetical protein n=1 Tax=Endozoicomonas sp. YOMI1 TaxID=2828739 RepID=UPI002147738C|nr:hypothetical protein [Endozoicomonas sp. YOMI1]